MFLEKLGKIIVMYIKLVIGMIDKKRLLDSIENRKIIIHFGIGKIK